MASSSVYNLTRFTALASGDVIPVVDISDTTQSAHGSLDSITVTNFFKLVPVAATFGASAVPAGLAAAYSSNGILFAVTPDTTGQRQSTIMAVGYGNGPSTFVGAAAGGPQTLPTAITTGSNLVAFYGAGYDGAAWATGGSLIVSASENWGVANHGTILTFSVTPITTTTSTAALVLSLVGTTTRIRGQTTAFSIRDAADAADNLIITNAGAGTFRSTVTATGLTISGTSGKIIASATSLLIRDTADANTNVSITDAGAVAIRSTVSFTGGTFTTSLISVTALTTPSALAATQFTGFASTVSGAAIMGFGTSNDVALMNRAGTVVLGVGPNTTLVNVPGSMTVGTDPTGTGVFRTSSIRVGVAARNILISDTGSSISMNYTGVGDVITLGSTVVLNVDLVLSTLGGGTHMVSVGAADSGGVGFKMLRVPN